jgi:hypothetical protein
MTIRALRTLLMELGKFTPSPAAAVEGVFVLLYLAAASRSLTAAQFTVFHHAAT